MPAQSSLDVSIDLAQRLLQPILIPSRPIEDDGEDHVTSYNEELAKLEKPSWYNAPWLFLECYLYRYNAPMIAMYGLS